MKKTLAIAAALMTVAPAARARPGHYSLWQIAEGWWDSNQYVAIGFMIGGVLVVAVRAFIRGKSRKASAP